MAGGSDKTGQHVNTTQRVLCPHAPVTTLNVVPVVASDRYVKALTG